MNRLQTSILLKWVGGGVLLSTLALTPVWAASSCEDLAKLHIKNVTISVAATVASPAAISDSLGQATVPTPICRVNGFISPTSDSHIGFEVWLPPADAWNHKLQAVGNGGLSGALNYRAIIPGFSRGYAMMTTDLGHTNTPPGSVEDASWALGHPQKVLDYAYRGEHLSTLAAKQIVDRYYGSAPAHAYYVGCSAGGIQGMTEVLRFPKDYDGYVIGDATPDHLGQEMVAFWNTLVASLADPANALQPAQMSLVHKEILKQCAGKDGGVSGDPFLSNPSACKFEPKSLLCGDGQDGSTCLNAAQVAMFEKIYQGPVDARTHEAIASGLTPGTELGWDRYFTGKKNPAGLDRPWAGFLVDMAYSDPQWLSQQKYLTFDFDKDYLALRQLKVGGESLDSSWNTHSRDLSAFEKQGGKIIHYHGWDDPNIPALEAVRFFLSVVADQAQRHRLTTQQAMQATEQFYRLFMVPGMGHCAGGDGPSSFGQGGRGLKAEAEYDPVIALEGWVEKGVAPEQFIGSRVSRAGAVDMTRPICAYPKSPVWNGTGNVNEAASFTCALPPRS